MVLLIIIVCEFYPHKTDSKQDSDIIQAEIGKHLKKWCYYPYRDRIYWYCFKQFYKEEKRWHIQDDFELEEI